MIFKELDDLQDALASASNTLYDVPDDYNTPETVTLRAEIDKRIDEALSAIRSWRETLELASDYESSKSCIHERE